MTRKSKDWREGAQSNILETINEIQDNNTRDETIYDSIIFLRNEVTKDDANIDEIRTVIRDIKKQLLELAEQNYNQAYEVQKLLSGSTLRNLEGKEPLNYSTPDGGAKHDAYYGMKAMNSNFGYKLRWRLNLNEWDKEEADRKPPRFEDLEPVTAEGTKKYTKTIGGRTVHVVIDERGMSPI